MIHEVAARAQVILPDMSVLLRHFQVHYTVWIQVPEQDGLLLAEQSWCFFLTVPQPVCKPCSSYDKLRCCSCQCFTCKKQCGTLQEGFSFLSSERALKKPFCVHHWMFNENAHTIVLPYDVSSETVALAMVPLIARREP